MRDENDTSNLRPDRCAVCGKPAADPALANTKRMIKSRGWWRAARATNMRAPLEPGAMECGAAPEREGLPDLDPVLLTNELPSSGVIAELLP